MAQAAAITLAAKIGRTPNLIQAFYDFMQLSLSKRLLQNSSGYVYLEELLNIREKKAGTLHAYLPQ
jgi:hypothetical protein